LAGHVVNGLASLGNAMLHHPEDVATTLTGIGLMALGVGGEVGGGLLDLTVVGSAIGVPVNVLSAGAIAGGGSLAYVGMRDVMMHSTSDDSVSPMRTDHTGSGGGEYKPTDGFRGSEYSKDEIAEFVNGPQNPAMPGGPRPTPNEVDAALSKAKPEKLVGQNADHRSGGGARPFQDRI
jgi:hypothetical protein